MNKKMEPVQKHRQYPCPDLSLYSGHAWACFNKAHRQSVHAGELSAIQSISLKTNNILQTCPYNLRSSFIPH